MEGREVDEELRELITQLVRIESENPSGNEAACARFMS
jgi:acetylornithine deacetylase/succinyl-diaminopimelate desuccinylase-like protein